jgi:hypothetical protein
MSPLQRLGSVDVVQAGLLLGLRAAESVRERGLPTGPVLCCIKHSLVHIPVEPGAAYRWHAPQTVCRTGTWACSADKHDSAYSTCVWVWLIPPDGRHMVTDSAGLLHGISVTRSAVARNSEISYGG